MIYGNIFVLLAALTAVYADIDYCDANLCDAGKKHIACGNNEDKNPLCPVSFTVPMILYYRNLIVRAHNLLRNKIARGFNHFPPAKRMATMVWDNELAKLAEVNVKQCEMRYDQCCNTPRFSYVGQNIAMQSWSKINFTISEIISRQIHAWFREHIFCPRHVIKSYTYLNDRPYSSFTTMVQDKSNRIGCAILSNCSGDVAHQAMTCNYAFSNIFGAAVYITGRIAALCTTGTDEIFTSLCSVREKYNLKKL